MINVLGHPVRITLRHDHLVELELNEVSRPTFSDLEREISQQLLDYEKGDRRGFDIPLAPRGTPFQLKVWNALLNIPYGETRTYQEIAQAIGQPKAARAVGGACHRNPIGIIIPCHRVIGSNGKLTGYYGGLDLKQQLLTHEKTVR